MSARQAEVELAFLEKTYDGDWEFALKEEYPYFSDLMDILSHRLMYNIRKIHYQYGSGKQQYRYGYSVSDACMRWLGCLFANWTEMQEKPKEEPKEPPKEPKKIKYCVECGRASIAHLECSECNGAVCVGCLRKHTARAHPAKEETKEKEWRWSERTSYHAGPNPHCQTCATETDVLYTCSQCHMANLCASCLSAHNQKEHSPYTGRKNYGSSGGFGGAHYFTEEDLFRQQEESSKWSREEADRLHELFGRYADMGSSGYERAKYTYTGSTSGTFTAVPLAVREAFSVLGIPPTQDASAIKKAYKALALKNHPDVGGDTQEMVKLNKAKDVALRYAGQKK